MDTFDLGDGAYAGVTDRLGGVSAPPYDTLNLSGRVGDDQAAVARNRERVAGWLGIAPRRVAYMRQVHGNDVAYVDAAPDVETPVVDALVTDDPGVALGALAADCAPVLLADPVARVIAAAHAGRAGVASGVIPATVRAMGTRGARTNRIVAAVGPAVCGECYEVPAETQEAVASAVPETRCVTRRGTPGLDVTAGVLAQLHGAGVAEVTCDPRCTVEDPRFYSHRRNERTGRFGGYVWLS